MHLRVRRKGELEVRDGERERERKKDRGMAREAPEIPTSSAASRIPLFGLRFARERRIRNDRLGEKSSSGVLLCATRLRDVARVS
ncbi:hypothetical protein PUN28_018866 [Cardiocondyla obscurior]|uniref:Uncharacterized protein n=1 Tax=Cardiocondyla obscurior TaxID=286306 RepID=A0AAW2EEI8_9HYME